MANPGVRVLLHAAPLQAMMLDAMSEHSEPSERTANELPEHLTFAEAAERLNITADAVRMRVHRGKLASVRVNERTFVLWPQPSSAEQTNEPRTERTGSVNRSDVQDNARLEVARLQGELTELRARLADTQEDRDRWHASATAAIERYNHDMQEMRGLLGREQVIALSATTTTAAEDAAQERDPGPVRDDAAVRAPETLIDRLRRLLGRL
jgi:excisionase family DNA binding protein